MNHFNEWKTRTELLCICPFYQIYIFIADFRHLLLAWSASWKLGIVFSLREKEKGVMGLGFLANFYLKECIKPCFPEPKMS